MNIENNIESRQDVSSITINDEWIHSFTLLGFGEVKSITIVVSWLTENFQSYITNVDYEQLLIDISEECRNKI